MENVVDGYRSLLLKHKTQLYPYFTLDSYGHRVVLAVPVQSNQTARLSCNLQRVANAT